MIAALFAAGVAASIAVGGAAGAAADSLHGSVVTDTLWSQSLGVKKAVVVYLPPSYARAPARRYAVAYYLHGLTGNETDWTKQGQLNVVMDSLVAAGGPEMIVVMPDGDDGWYTTWNELVTLATCRRYAPAREPVETFCVPWQHYDDYIARDVVQFTDKKYRTLGDRAHRAIAGLSMGGYGAMALAFEYPELFAAAASHSGVLEPLFLGPMPFDGQTAPEYATTPALLQRKSGTLWKFIAPAFGRDTAAWWSRDPGRRLEKLVAAKGPAAVPALYVDAGTEDALVDDSRVFKWTVTRLGLPISYHEAPGRHDWLYWRAHEGESLHWIAGQIAK